MNKTIKYGLFIIGGLFVWQLFQKSQAGKRLNVFFRGIGLKNSSGIIPTVVANFAVQNTSNQKITIKSISGDLTVNGKYLANISQFSPIVIQPNSETILPINIKAGIISIIDQIVPILKKKTGTKNFVADFNGTVNADGFVIPVSETVKIV